MNVQEMIMQAWKQQWITDRKDADVSFLIPGKWPANGRKRLAKRRGPLGQCVAEYEDAVLCLFKADEVIRFLSDALPTITMDALERLGGTQVDSSKQNG